MLRFAAAVFAADFTEPPRRPNATAAGFLGLFLVMRLTLANGWYVVNWIVFGN